MAKSAQNRRRFSSRKFRSTPYPTSRPRSDAGESFNLKETPVMEKRDWEEATCSVCMEFPHNAVLLLCSSHDNGCRPYMCGTSHRHSNCLEQFKNSYSKVTRPPPGWPLTGRSKAAATELSCPLCRRPVKGWTVVEPARKHLNDKRRSCSQDDCSFVGTYRELKKHARSGHPRARPREINPEMEEKWRALELESERQDVMSTIMASMPRSMVFGDYVIEMADAGGVAGAGGEDFLLLNRNILNALREGARLLRLQWEEGGGAGIAVDVSRADGTNRRRRRRSRRPSPAI